MGLFGVFMFMGVVGAVFMMRLVMDPGPSPRVSQPPPRPPQTLVFVSPVPPSPRPVAIPVQPPPPPPPPVVEKPRPVAPPMPRTNEPWGALQLAKHLRDYDYCGKEAILRDGSIPRSYRLRARFDAKGQGRTARLTPKSVAMMDACIENRTKYIYLGKPPEAREFAVELNLSFAHLRPKGQPETRDEQWGRHSDD